MSRYILGISAGNHDAAAALLDSSQVVAAVEEEKLARVRRARGLPARSIQYCLESRGLRPEQVEYIALARPLTGADPGTPLPGESWIPQRLKLQFPSSKLVVLDHHLCHAAAAYFPSPFDQAGVLTLDEYGDLKSGSLSLAGENQLQPLEDCYLPDSLGRLYSRVSALAGFAPGGDEHKLQWLSAWGRPAYAPVFRHILAPRRDSLLAVDQSYFRAGGDGAGGFSEKFLQEAGLPADRPLSRESRADLAASMQASLEESVLEIAQRLKTRHGVSNLCLGGGVALNALLVERLETAGASSGLFVQPAAGNAGNAIGAALYCAHVLLGVKQRCPMQHLFYGPAYSDQDIKDALENCKLRFSYLPKRPEVIAAAVEALRADQIVGWFQGPAEFGPRALGARSILASPLGPYVNENLNQFVKHREQFRPFAASVPEERAGEFFEFQPMARFLATVGRVKEVHRDKFASNLLPARVAPGCDAASAFSGAAAGAEAQPGGGAPRIRVHVVERKTNPLFWELLDAFGRATGVPVLFNTSFNLFGEPLVCSPRDAVRSFYCSGLDQLVIGHFSVSK